MKKAVFLDRDGILNRVIIRDNIVSSPRHLHEFEIIEEAKQLVNTIKSRDFFVAVVTNQPDVDREKLDPANLAKMHDILRKTFPIDTIEACTSGDDSDFRRKPNPGMILNVAKMHDIALKDSCLIGDGYKDIAAGKSAGVKTILLCTSYNSAIHGSADYNCNSMFEVIKLIETI